MAGFKGDLPAVVRGLVSSNGAQPDPISIKQQLAQSHRIACHVEQSAKETSVQ
jgi:hypothetical protein